MPISPEKNPAVVRRLLPQRYSEKAGDEGNVKASTSLDKLPALSCSYRG